MNTDEVSAHVIQRFDAAIAYYWSASRKNKRAYKTFRYLSTVLGALVTLVASLSAMDLIAASPVLKTTFAIVTPILAATAAIMSGLAQSFQWGATWHDMVMTAQELEREKDDWLSTPESERDAKEQLASLNEAILGESRGFFERILGRSRESAGPPANRNHPP